MEFGIKANDCSTCNNIEVCSRSCVLHTGKALINFIEQIDIIETRIGEYSSRRKGTKPDLVVSGHTLYDINSPSWLLTDINTPLDASDKFCQAFDKSTFQIALMYCSRMKFDAERTKSITNKITSINNNKMLVLPFKPHVQCIVSAEVNDTKLSREHCTLECLKWQTNKDNFKLECTLNFKAVSSSLSDLPMIKLPLTDYISKFELSQMDIQAKSSKHDKNMIKITNQGIFKPIIIKEGTNTIAIDGTYVYYNNNSESYIIGYWDDNDKLIIKSDIKLKAITKINDNINYIKNHRRFIAPYLVYSPNTIVL